MTLSGYLFAKLLDGKSISFKAFLWNRMLRLLPLLVAMILVVGFREWMVGKSLSAYALSIAQGIVLPTLPKGGWSITVEFHFYAILPLFLWLIRKSKWLPFSIVVAAIVLRSLIFYAHGEVESLAYWTIVGRVDQFALGMIAFQFRSAVAHRHVVAAATLLAFTAFYWYLDYHGGVFQAPGVLWILLPTIEGLAYGVSIAWYEQSFAHSKNSVARFIARVGEYSYSIYLLHVLVVFKAAAFVNERIMGISNFYVACVWALVFLLLMIPPAYLSFRFIESPFLKLRKRYVLPIHGTQKMPAESVEQPGWRD